MKRLVALLLLLFCGLCAAEEVTLTKSTVLRTERSMVSLKAGTVVELISRDEKNLTVRYNNITGTIPAGSIAAAADPKDAKKKEETPAPPAEKGAQTNYGKAVEKAKENASKHEKNLVKPTDEVLQDK
jgi:hypothetical protein